MKINYKRTAVVGQKVIFICSSNGSSHWYFDSLHSIRIDNDNHLEIELVSIYHGGIYFCYGWNSVNKKNFIAARFFEVVGKEVVIQTI